MDEKTKNIKIINNITYKRNIVNSIWWILKCSEILNKITLDCQYNFIDNYIMILQSELETIKTNKKLLDNNLVNDKNGT